MERGVFPLVSRVIKNNNDNLTFVGLQQELSSEEEFRIRTNPNNIISL